MKINIEEIKKKCDVARGQKILVDGIKIEKGCIDNLPDVLKRFYPQVKKITVISDTNTYPIVGKRIEKMLTVNSVVLEAKGLHADEHGVELAKEALDRIEKTDMLIACGSGTIHDITRYHAYHTGIDFISVPTAASVDGFVSTMAAMTWKGMKQTFTAVSPVYVLADTEIFSKAPKRLTASGVGDLLGKYTALCDWEIAHLITGEYISWEIVDWEKEFLNDLVQNLDGINRGSVEAYENLMAGLLLSGLAMQIIGYSRPASGCEHHCSHLWEEAAINQPIDYYHGEKVGVGMVICSEVYHKALNHIKKGSYKTKTTMDIESNLLKDAFKDEKLYEEIVQENTPNVMENITGAMIHDKADGMISILQKLPSSQEMQKWLKKVGAPTTLSEIGLDDNLKSKTLRVSPYVRKRLTFMRLLKFFDFYEDIIE